MRPTLAVIMETELWPNLFHEGRARGIPVMLVNGRLSARSAARYQRVRGLIAATLQQLDWIAAQGAAVGFLDLDA